MLNDLLVAALRDPRAVEVRRRLFRQLISSLLYEGAVTASASDGGCVIVGRDDDDRDVRYVVGTRRAVGFDRVRVTAPVLRVAADGVVAEADSLPRFLAETSAVILDGAHPTELVRFTREIEETRVKDTLAQHVRALRGDRLAGADHDTLEGTVTDGHRYHPTYKSRIGFDLADDVAYGPEFLPELHPLWLAAHRSIVEVTGASDVSREELGSATAAAFDDAVRDAGGDPAEYIWLPVHPWQFREVVWRAFADEIADGRLVVLGPDPAAFAVLQSIRTLSCRDVPGRHQLKLALSITNTSTARGLAPHTVRNAARISDWLRGLVAGDEVLAPVIVLGEVRGVSVIRRAPGRVDTEGTLAAVWREPLAPRLAAGERAVPMTALTACELDGTPMIAPWIERHGAERWVAAVVDTVALPLVHLLLAHGVACESHAQNVSVVHVDGLPCRVALRDFHDGVRFSRRLLADPDAAPALDPPPAHHTNRNSFVETEDPALVTDFLLDAFFFVNLGELGLHLDEHGLLGEDRFWSIVAGRVDAHQREHGTGAFDLFAPTLAVEKLTTRRLTPDTELALHTVSNPLHRFREAGC
ncbi:siderophore biosynthesis protein [Actinomycetospora endophytica]|uniref:Siderophore biosynthesis protein n=1 Tax=Actinomycetospora endophytica TaxID=2291215 RepID=A0ABS8PE50_9PSEU|nr:IucA/IucC family protein [Actinomycetospora endophytica]MCD2195755.1 siderophore biosynthesis protein [Actinomycetospora endophytica]